MSSEDDNSLSKIANLLALVVTKDQSKGTAALTLNACGFSNKQIASLIGTNENSVRAAISAGKRKQSDNG